MEYGVYSYLAVRRWTNNVDVFSLDKVIIPINSENQHWILAVIDLQKQADASV
jgi:sentrin-specific protease 1